MLTVWICVGLTAVASFAIKAAGPALLANRSLPSRATGVIALLAPALLAGLVVADVLGPDWSSANGPLALGIVSAIGARTAGTPATACAITAIFVTALARAVL